MRRALFALLAVTGPLLLAGCGPTGSETAAPSGFAIEAIDAFIASKQPNTTKPNWRTMLPRPPKVAFPADKHVYWTLDTNKGRMVLKLWHDVAPMHVSNLIYLTRLRFYDGLTFHRVIQGFMAQGGCPYGNGSGMPGYGIPLEVSLSAKHDRAGILSTANTGRPNSDGCQFFLMLNPNSGLDGKYSAYGNIVEGMETLRALEALGGRNDATSKPRERLVIEKATVELR